LRIANGCIAVGLRTTSRPTLLESKSTTTTFDGAPTLSTFNVTLSCKDAGGKQKERLGDVTTSLTW
jgi:hypothetical protein